MHNPKYCLFYDNHTMPSCPDVGEHFDAELFTDRIRACGVDFLTFHARCNMGMAYYDTKIGIRHPMLKYDLFGKLADACSRKGIALSAYLNGGISSEEGLRHREWTTLMFDGREYREPRLTPYVRTMCYNSPYREHLISMIEEIARKYPVSGFFIDCLLDFPCVCPICVREMKKFGINWEKEEEVRRFSGQSAIRMARDIAKTAKAINPEFLLYFNGVSFEEQAEFGTHLECECLPCGEWGYEYLPVLSHYMRTLGDKPVLNMNGRFYDWGDFGGLRPEDAIKSELLYGLANGMRPNVGGHFHPRGDLEIAVLDRIEKIYMELQTMEPWFENAKNLTDIAIVYPEKFQKLLFDGQLRGAVRMLCELKQQFDIVTEFSDWGQYQVLVIPDDVVFKLETARRIKAHIDAGKAVISSGISGMNPEKTHFAMEKEWGLKFRGDCDFDPVYFAAGKEFGEGLPEMPLSLYSSGIKSEALPGTRIGAYLVKPYYNRKWDGEHAFFYNPPEKITDIPALTVCGKVAHFSHRIFSGYACQASVELRRLFSNVLEKLFPEPLLKTENLPSFARAFVTKQPDRQIVHILSYVPELRGKKTQMIEDPIPIFNAKIALRNDWEDIPHIYLLPGNCELPPENCNGYTRVTIPVVNGYAMAVFERQKKGGRP